MMAFEEFKLKVVFAFALSVILSPAVKSCLLTTIPSESKFELPAGRPFTIICSSVTRDQESKMSWITPSIRDQDERNIRIQKITEKSLSLVFINPKASHSGTYSCTCEYEIQGSYRKQERKRITKEERFIEFHNPELRFETSFENIIAEEGATVEIKCTAIGHSPTTYQWRNQNQEIIHLAYYRRDQPVSALKSEDKSILKIIEMNSSYAGSYTCAASNRFGIARKEYEILIHNSTDTIPRIRHVQIVNLTANSVQFGVSASGIASSIRVRYQEKYFPASMTVYEKEWKRGDLYEVRDLVPGHSYSFRFIAIPQDEILRDTTNNNLWSKEQEIIMLPLKPDVVFHVLSGGIIKIAWNREKEGEKIDKYKLVYFPITLDKEGNWNPNNCPITIDIPFCSTADYTLPGLSSKTYYELQLQAHTASGYGEPFKQKIYVQ